MTRASTRSMSSAGTSRSRRAARDHRLHVEAVAARADQHEQRVEPGRADVRPVPVAEQAAAVGPAAARCRRGRRCGRACRPPTASAKPAASAAASSPWGRSRVAFTCSQKAGQVGQLVGDRVELEVRRSGRELVGHDLEGVEARRPARPCRHGRRGARASTYSRPSTTQSPSIVQSSRGAGTVVGQGPQLARLLAVRRGEGSLGRRRGRLHEVPRAVGARQHRREAGREAAALRGGGRRPATRSAARSRCAPPGADAPTPGGGRCARAGSGSGWRRSPRPSSRTRRGARRAGGGQAAGAVWQTASTLLPSGSRTKRAVVVLVVLRPQPRRVQRLRARARSRRRGTPSPASTDSAREGDVHLAVGSHVVEARRSRSPATSCRSRRPRRSP